MLIHFLIISPEVSNVKIRADKESYLGKSLHFSAVEVGCERAILLMWQSQFGESTGNFHKIKFHC